MPLPRGASLLAEARAPLSALAERIVRLTGLDDAQIEAIDPDTANGRRIIGAVALLWTMVWWFLAFTVVGIGIVGALTRLASVMGGPLLFVFALGADLVEIVCIASLILGVALGLRLRVAAGRAHDEGAKLVEQAGLYGVTDPASLLRPAAAAFKHALRICPRVLSPRDWAASQVSLGDVQALVAEYTPSPEAQLVALAEAETAYHAALDVLTRHRTPRAWTRTLSALGAVLARQAECADETERRRLLGAAIAAYGTTIEYTARDGTREEWAGTQAILGRLLGRAAAQVEGTERMRLLTSAIATHRAALEVFTRESDASRWAAIEGQLGTALRDLAELSLDDEQAQLLEQALTAFRAAQQVFTRWTAPLEWAALQTEVGRALRDAAALMEGAQALKLLREAVTVLDLSLEVRARDDMPAAWAATQHYLGQALCDQAWLCEGKERAELAEEALAALSGALDVYGANGEAPSPPAHSRVRAERGRVEALLG